jgi:hypothetical protein
MLPQIARHVTSALFETSQTVNHPKDRRSGIDLAPAGHSPDRVRPLPQLIIVNGRFLGFRSFREQAADDRTWSAVASGAHEGTLYIFGSDRPNSGHALYVLNCRDESAKKFHSPACRLGRANVA